MLFKLYPLEWLSHAEFARHITTAETRFIEPAWKMLLSNKALLAKLWVRYPNHPNLLPAYFTPFELPKDLSMWVKTIVRSRRCQCFLL